MKKTLKTLLILIIGLSLGLGLGYFKLHRERKSYERKIQGLQEKADLLQKRYAEQKALETNLLRGKSLAEGQKRSVQMEMQRLEEEKKVVLEEKARLAEQGKALQMKLTQVELSLKDAREGASRFRAEMDKAEKTHLKALEDQRKQLAQAQGEKQRMESEFKTALREKEQALGRCISHNQKLSATARELLTRYENKGVLGSVFQNEPFTQIRKVEMENLIEEYRSKIEEGTLEKKGKAGR
jgi:chromosome segregation ATPase